MIGYTWTVTTDIEGCKRDLDNALKGSIRVGGMIMGDDYFWSGAVLG